MSKQLLVIASVVAGLLALSGCTTKVVTTDGAAPLHTVTAAGEGKTVAAPDMAEMYFGTTVVAPDAKAALGQVNETAKKITEAVKGAGVDAKDIQTANVSVWPEQNYEGDKATITGYRASIQVRVKIRKIDEVGAIIGAASEAGSNEIGGPNFMLDDDDAVSAEAIELAIADARARAEVMAKAAGKTLGEIISVNETGASVPIYYAGGAEARTLSADVAIEPGQLDVRANVTVVFELK